jgi:hypothetical protein
MHDEQGVPVLFSERRSNMRKGTFLIAMLAVGFLAASGCNRASTEVQGEGGKKLGVTVAPATTSVTQGDTAKLVVRVKRTEFDGPVNLQFNNLPDGVSIQESNLWIDKGKDEATFTLKAADKAPAAANKVATVAATGGGMTAPPLEIKLAVREKTMPVKAEEKKGDTK